MNAWYKMIVVVNFNVVARVMSVNNKPVIVAPYQFEDQDGSLVKVCGRG
jgi:hypothetical protein